MNVKYVKYSLKDIPWDIVPILQDMNRGTYTGCMQRVFNYFRQQNLPGTVYVAMDAMEKVLGWCLIVKNRDDNMWVQIYVDFPMRGNGIGLQLALKAKKHRPTITGTWKDSSIFEQAGIPDMHYLSTPYYG